MAALRRIRILWENPPTGAFKVEYEDTLRPNRRVIDQYPVRGFVSVGEAARITNIPKRTLYYWLKKKKLREKKADSDNYRIPLSEVRRLLKR